ncbi:MAG TPA: response regulator transcription factor [Bryobacteraceae bacterium]|nr:response regulator transcription factor [Bryobacteraceae bacterium]
MTKKNVLICDNQPVAVEGIRWLLENTEDLHFGGSIGSPEAIYALLRSATRLPHAEAEDENLSAPEASAEYGMGAGSLPRAEVLNPDLANLMGAIAGDPNRPDPSASLAPYPPELAGLSIDVVVVDKGLGLLRVIDLLQKLASAGCSVPVVVWGSSIAEGEALRLLQFGARGILLRTSEASTLLTCLRAVTSGGAWMEDGIFGASGKLLTPRRPQLTTRERQIAALVERGLRNRDIAGMLGIQPGTVKIHVKHIFEKTGVRGRYGLALSGLQRKGLISAPVTPPFGV